jgi:glycosyltransferase involved in cell wall biosynthesis
VPVSAVIPVLDEEPTLAELHARLGAVLRSLSPDYEMVFVNDGSRDGSLGALRVLAAGDPRTIVVDLRRRFGKTPALAAGFAEARGDVLLTLDADLQDVPEELPKLVARLGEGFDLVTGRKRPRQDPWTRRLASFVFNGAVSLLSGTRVRDVNSGLKALRREVAAELPLHGELHRFLPVLARARGFRVSEVDVAHGPRRFGRSRYGWGRYVTGLVDTGTLLVLTRYGKRPFHLFGVFGLVLAAAGAAILGYLSVGWLFGRWIANRPLFIAGGLFVILGIQSAFFGILAELVVVAGSGRDRGYLVREVIRTGARDDG